MSVSFPNESQEYRTARNALLQREIALRREMESVAAQLRSLPPGGPIPVNYVFNRVDEHGAVGSVRMSELFGSGDTLMVYHFEPLWTLFDLTPGGRPAADEQMEYECCRK